MNLVLFEKNAENEHLGENDKSTLLELKEKYPEGKILKILYKFSRFTMCCR